CERVLRAEDREELLRLVRLGAQRLLAAGAGLGHLAAIGRAAEAARQVHHDAAAAGVAPRPDTPRREGLADANRRVRPRRPADEVVADGEAGGVLVVDVPAEVDRELDVVL